MAGITPGDIRPVVQNVIESSAVRNWLYLEKTKAISDSLDKKLREEKN